MHVSQDSMRREILKKIGFWGELNKALQNLWIVGDSVPPSPPWLLRRISSDLERPSRDPSSIMVRRFGVKLTVMCLVWCWVNAGTEPMAEAARNEAEDLRIFPCRRIGEDTSEDAAATRNLRRPWAEEPPMPPRRRLRGRPEVQALTSRCPKRVARVELVMWNYLNGLWSVDCNEGICRDIPPPSRVIFVIVSDRFPGAI